MARRENDFYPTPAQLTKELLKRVEISGTVFECCAGDGAIAKELEENCLITKVITNDIDSNRKCDLNADASLSIYWNKYFGSCDWVVTNPPYKDVAPRIVPLAFEHCRIGIAMLLRLSYLEPCTNRGDWLEKHKKFMTDIIIFGQPRPSFTNNGKVDTSTTCWIVWQKKPKHFGTEFHFVTNWKQ
ncbi:MAG TPA: hypothetical protein V6D19_05480 [Stenomitos sp.]